MIGIGLEKTITSLQGKNTTFAMMVAAVQNAHKKQTRNVTDLERKEQEAVTLFFVCAEQVWI